MFRVDVSPCSARHYNRGSREFSAVQWESGVYKVLRVGVGNTAGDPLGTVHALEPNRAQQSPHSAFFPTERVGREEWVTTLREKVKPLRRCEELVDYEV